MERLEVILRVRITQERPVIIVLGIHFEFGANKRGDPAMYTLNKYVELSIKIVFEKNPGIGRFLVVRRVFLVIFYITLRKHSDGVVESHRFDIQRR